MGLILARNGASWYGPSALVKVVPPSPAASTLTMLAGPGSLPLGFRAGNTAKNRRQAAGVRMPMGMGSACFDKQAKFVHNHSPWNTTPLTPYDEKASPDCKKHPHLVEISFRKRHDRRRPVSVTRRLEPAHEQEFRRSVIAQHARLPSPNPPPECRLALPRPVPPAHSTARYDSLADATSSVRLRAQWLDCISAR